MKQMISNHREIESLEDFIYYDKSSGKIVIKKELDLAVPISATKLYLHKIQINELKCRSEGEDVLAKCRCNLQFLSTKSSKYSNDEVISLLRSDLSSIIIQKFSLRDAMYTLVYGAVDYLAQNSNGNTLFGKTSGTNSIYIFSFNFNTYDAENYSYDSIVEENVAEF